jgi:putative hemolysin
MVLSRIDHIAILIFGLTPLPKNGPMLISTETATLERPRRYRAEIAGTAEDIRAALALRYRVFAEEMGAHLHSRCEGLDYDELDDFCDHLVVRDNQTDEIVGCSRLLTDIQAKRLGRYYSEGEFELRDVLALPGRFLEIGRTCVDPGQRGSLILATLWNGLAEYVSRGGFNYLMGCASISPGPNGFSVDAVYRAIAPEQFGPGDLKVAPRRPVPPARRCARDESGIPPLLQAYLRLGCWVLGEPFWDEDFDCMDVFILLDLSQMTDRYEKKFLSTRSEKTSAEHRVFIQPQ